MRRLALLASAAVLGIAPAAFAQTGPYRVSDHHAAPGLYGTSYGFASHGVPRTHSEFTAMPWSPYYANYRPSGFMPGPFGVGLWKPAGYSAGGDVYGQPTGYGSYRTFPVTAGTGLTPADIAPPPPMGVYAPAYGPGIGAFGE